MSKKRIAIACQGGGSQTAFTAGFLATCLQRGVQDQHDIVALSGTSGGAICACLAWYSLLKAANGSAEPPHQGLLAFWRDNSATHPWERLFNRSMMRSVRMLEKSRVFSTEANPNDWPMEWAHNVLKLMTPRREFFDLRALIEKHVAFSELGGLIRESSPRLLVGAVNVLSGDFKTFDSGQHDITVDMILASAAVPSLFKAVEIEGEHYWDGLFAENPPVGKLLQALPDELWIIQINPKTSPKLPHTFEDIRDRRNELAGNIMLAIELRIVQIFNELLERDALKKSFLNHVPMTPTDIRVIGMSDELAHALDYTSKLDRDSRYIETLMEHGQQQADAFLDEPAHERYDASDLWRTENILFSHQQ